MNQPNSITLDTPIKRGDTEITAITLRKPTSGELRGLSLSELLQMDVTALCKLMPRISSPMLTDNDVSSLDPADLVQLGAVAAGFLLPKAAQPEVFPTA